MRDQDQGLTKRFKYTWKRHPEILLEYEQQFLKWTFPLNKNDFKNKEVLDAGCGIGRNSFWALTYGAKKVIAFDFDEDTVAIAKKNLSGFFNSEVLYRSIYDIGYNGDFDIVFSIGVIHHLRDPRKALENLVRAARPEGVVLVWVYGHEGNEHIIRFINILRMVTSRIPLLFVYLLSYFFSVPLYIYTRLIKPRSDYLRQLSRARFNNIHAIVFDQLIPRIAHYWKKSEVLALVDGLGLGDVRVYRVNNNSWTIVGRKMNTDANRQ